MFWPAFTSAGKPLANGGVSAAHIGTIAGPKGTRLVTYHGHPLYYYAADASTSGKTKGEDIEQFGAGWYLVGARGEPFEPESGSRSGSNSGSNTGGGGYG